MRSPLLRFAAVSLLALACTFAVAVAGDRPGSDELFEEARKLGFDGKREEARELCREILASSPGYTDVRVLLGRLWAWDKRYDEARVELTRAVAEKPGYIDARVALIDVELWSGHPRAALVLADQGLMLNSSNARLLERRARALGRLDRPQEALDAALAAVQADPGQGSARRLYRTLLDENFQNKVAIADRVDTFSDNTDNWNEATLSYRRSSTWGSVTGRVNHAQRFDENGTQFEVDAYPRIGERMYAYVNYGHSTTKLYPENRYSAELYRNFNRGFEGSFGFRQLDFSSSDVTIFTGTVARYMGNYWVSLRPNYVEGQDSNSVSGGLSVRRFFNSRYEYAELVVSGGVKKETNLIAQAEDDLDSFAFRAEIRRRVSHKVILRGAAGYRSQQFLNNRTRDGYFVGFGVEKFF